MADADQGPDDEQSGEAPATYADTMTAHALAAAKRWIGILRVKVRGQPAD